MSMFFCISCHELFDPEEFEWVDDELDAQSPRCPDCSSAHRIKGQQCEHCDQPATHEVELGFLCSDHHDEYVDGFLRD